MLRLAGGAILGALRPSFGFSLAFTISRHSVIHDMRLDLSQDLSCCPPKPALSKRPLIPQPKAAELAEIFNVLANDTRLRLLHALARGSELCVTELGETVGMKAQAVSNQLRRLLDRGILAARRDGTSIYYRIIDPCVPQLLEQGLCLAEDSRRRRQ